MADIARVVNKKTNISSKGPMAEPNGTAVKQHPTLPTQALQQLVTRPSMARPADILQLQRTLGNRSVSNLLSNSVSKRPLIQAKLTVNAPGDKYEQEADRVAEQVIRMPAVQPGEIGEEYKPVIMTLPDIQRNRDGTFEVNENFARQLRASHGRGQSLSPALREEFETKFGEDFSGVNIHTDAQSAALNQSIQAQAFTQGQDIYIGNGKYHPDSIAGKRLLAHELAHIVQQNGHKTNQQRSVMSQAGASTQSIQRLPTKDDITKEVGEPHSGLLESTKYKPVLDALNKFHKYIKKTPASSRTLDKLMDKYQKVQTAALGYLGGKAKGRDRDEVEQLGNEREKYDKLKRILVLYDEVAVERVQAVLLLERVPNDATLSWAQVLEGRSTGRYSKGLKKLHTYGKVFDEKAIKDRQKGGTNEVAKVKLGQKDKGFWKADKRDVPLTPLIKAYQGVTQRDDEKMGAFLPGTRFEHMGFQAIENEYIVPMIAGIIPEYAVPELDLATNMPKRQKPVKADDNVEQKQPDPWRQEKDKRWNIYKQQIDDLAQKTNLVMDYDLHLAKRDVAMFRLDQLLGVGIITPTRLALMKSGDEYKVGSLMKGAKGTQAGNVEWNNGNVNQEGGELQRQLSRLQLLDILAHQVDRNPGNFFLEFDGQGEVTHITGIDNDMAFGKLAKDIQFGGQEYPGISAFVDKELAEVILKLDEKNLVDTMYGLLSDDEIDALMGRLKQLKAYLKVLSDNDKLLSRNQWNKATAQGLIKEGKSYYAALHQKRLIKKQ